MTRNTDFYVYLYLREDKTPYYVGKGRARRAYGNHKHTPVPSKDRIVFMKQNLTNEEAKELERLYIKFYGRKCEGGLLINLTSGGEGLEGHRHTEETKRLISEKKKGVSIKGTPRTPEEKERARQRRLGTKASPETRKKMSEARKGKVPWNKGIKWKRGASKNTPKRDANGRFC